MLNQNHFRLSQPIFMMTEKDSSIIIITMTLQENYSELSKHIGEMTITIPDTGNPEIAINNVKDYNYALANLLKNHCKDHGCEGK